MKAWSGNGNHAWHAKSNATLCLASKGCECCCYKKKFNHWVMMTHARVTAPKGRIPRARVSHINQTDEHRLMKIPAQVQGNNCQSKNAMNVILSCRVQNLRHVQYKSIMSF